MISREALVSHTIVNDLAVDTVLGKSLTMVTMFGPIGEPTIKYVLLTTTVNKTVVRQEYTSFDLAWKSYV